MTEVRVAVRRLERIQGPGAHPGAGSASRGWECIQGLGVHPGSRVHLGVQSASRGWECIQGLGVHPGAGSTSRVQSASRGHCVHPGDPKGLECIQGAGDPGSHGCATLRGTNGPRNLGGHNPSAHHVQTGKEQGILLEESGRGDPAHKTVPLPQFCVTYTTRIRVAC